MTDFIVEHCEFSTIAKNSTWNFRLELIKAGNEDLALCNLVDAEKPIPISKKMKMVMGYDTVPQGLQLATALEFDIDLSLLDSTTKAAVTADPVYISTYTQLKYTPYNNVRMFPNRWRLLTDKGTGGALTTVLFDGYQVSEETHKHTLKRTGELIYTVKCLGVEKVALQNCDLSNVAVYASINHYLKTYDGKVWQGYWLSNSREISQYTDEADTVEAISLTNFNNSVVMCFNAAITALGRGIYGVTETSGLLFESLSNYKQKIKTEPLQPDTAERGDLITYQGDMYFIVNSIKGGATVGGLLSGADENSWVNQYPTLWDWLKMEADTFFQKIVMNYGAGYRILSVLDGATNSTIDITDIIDDLTVEKSALYASKSISYIPDGTAQRESEAMKTYKVSSDLSELSYELPTNNASVRSNSTNEYKHILSTNERTFDSVYSRTTDWINLKNTKYSFKNIYYENAYGELCRVHDEGELCMGIDKYVTCDVPIPRPPMPSLNSKAAWGIDTYKYWDARFSCAGSPYLAAKAGSMLYGNQYNAVVDFKTYIDVIYTDNVCPLHHKYELDLVQITGESLFSNISKYTVPINIEIDFTTGIATVQLMSYKEGG